MAIPKLAKEAAITWISKREWQKGIPYAQNGSLSHHRIQGMTIKADCWGTSAQPYHVKIHFNKTEITSCLCSCPVGVKCKHAAALLYTWVHFPETFSHSENLDSILNALNKKELVALIKRMIDTNPALERIVELKDVLDKPLTDKIVRQQVKGMLKNIHYNYDRHEYYDGFPDDSFSELELLIENAESFVSKEHDDHNREKEGTLILKVIIEEIRGDDELRYTYAEDLMHRCEKTLDDYLSKK